MDLIRKAVVSSALKVNKGIDEPKLMSAFHLFFRRHCSPVFFFMSVFR